jgi:hypothetical protein
METRETDHDASATPDDLPKTSTTPATPRVLKHWLIEGVRSALLLRTRWQALHASPAIVFVLCALSVLIGLGLQRLWIVGPANFLWQQLLAGWLATAAAAWGCYALTHGPARAADADAPNASQLFSLLLVQGTVLSTLFGGAWAVLVHQHQGTPPLSPNALWVMWGVLWLWLGLAQTLTLLRGSPRKAWALLVTTLLLAIGVVDNLSGHGTAWVADASATTGDRPPPAQLSVTQELMEAQPALLARRLDELQAQRPGVVDLYALTFAPYAHEDVFRRESQMVADVLASRFDTAGRSLQLVNHVDSVNEWPWATPLNLKRAIRHVAAQMDKEEDILFIHLTSHGAHNGALAAQFWPLAIEAVTPAELKSWLDEVGIRHRVISVSACYSGSWIEPLGDDNTLVMTAADSEHTSFGCGRQSELTYFGRAVFDEQLRLHTRSFVEAHAAARPIIEQREQAAGKTDGYSNPQLVGGEPIRSQLELLRRRLENG